MCMREWDVMFGCDRRVVLGIVKSRMSKVCIAKDGGETFVLERF